MLILARSGKFLQAFLERFLCSGDFSVSLPTRHHFSLIRSSDLTGKHRVGPTRVVVASSFSPAFGFLAICNAPRRSFGWPHRRWPWPFSVRPRVSPIVPVVTLLLAGSAPWSRLVADGAPWPQMVVGSAWLAQLVVVIAWRPRLVVRVTWWSRLVVRVTWWPRLVGYQQHLVASTGCGGAWMLVVHIRLLAVWS